MSKYIIQRLSLGALTVLGELVLVFIIMRVIPGDPVRLVVGFDASYEEIAAVQHRLGIDQPIPIQFARYVADIVSGDFGRSIRSGRPVLREVGPAVTNTLKLVGCTILLTTTLGVTAGVIAARWPNSIVDHLVMIAATFGICTPSFFLALVLMLLFAIRLQWLPSIGVGGFEHLILPTLTLTTVSIAGTARMTRASLLEVLSADYVRTARAKGLSQTAVLSRHAMPNSLIPIITIVGLQTSYMLGGAALVETVFAYPGIGWLLVESIGTRDFPIVQTAILFVAFTTALTNLLTDLLYLVFDPRIRQAT